jgi:hypothetical protein
MNEIDACEPGNRGIALCAKVTTGGLGQLYSIARKGDAVEWNDWNGDHCDEININSRIHIGLDQSMPGTRGCSHAAKRCQTLAVSWSHGKSGSDSGTSERSRAIIRFEYDVLRQILSHLPREYASKNSDLPHEDRNILWLETSRNPYRDDGRGSSSYRGKDK